MTTAEELLATVLENEEILVADLNTRVISIPATLRNLGVESDDDVRRLHFSVPRYYGEVDLSEFKIQINFENAKGEGDFWPVDDLVVNEDNTLTFSWLVDRSAFMYAGNVIFSLCMKKYDTDGTVVKELNTTFASLPVLKGLETSKEVVENNPSAFDAVLVRLYAVEDIVNNGLRYYTPDVTQLPNGNIQFVFKPSEPTMPALVPVQIEIPNSGGNVDLTGYATEQFVRDGYQPKGNYLTEHQDISGKLDVDKLPEAVNDALTKAAASGEFDGADGKSAYAYAQEAGYTGTEEEFADKLAQEYPTTLPNTNALTINGTTYDGSEPVNITLEAPDIDTEEVNALVDSKMLSVKSFGAKGDGVTDDSDAFIAALANKQSVVFVPGGTYKLSKTIVITENSCLELSQNTLLDFTQTSGNCIEMRGSATLRGNHGNINVSGSFTGNVISVDTALDGVVHGNILPYGNWTPLWQRQRFIHDVNITRTEGGFRGSLTGGHSGTALYVSANYGTKEDYNGSSTAPITVIWGMSVTGLRIGGAFDYGINIENMDKTDSGYDNQNDPAWNHDMRIEAVIVGCETGVRVFNCNTAHLDVTIEPAPSINKVDGEYVKYAKNGIILEHSNHIDLSQSLVWDWNTNGTLVDKDAKNAHIALIGVCKGVILSDFLYHEHSSTDIRKLIYTDTPSNFDSLIILQEPFTRWFKPKDGVPYFFDGTADRALMLRSDKFTAEQAEFIHDAEGYYERIPNYTNVVADYEDGYYINSSGTTSALAGMVTTGFIPLDGNVVHTFRVGGTGIRWKTDLYSDTNYCRMAFYDADKNLVDYVMPVGSMLGNDDNPNSSYPHFIEDDTVDSAIVTSSLTAGINHGAAYFRISAVGKGENLIITIDEKVEDKAIWHGEPRRLDESIYAQKTMISSPSGKVFELTVADDGTLSATEIVE